MSFLPQLKVRQKHLKRTARSLSVSTGLSAPHISAILTGKKDARASTFQALAEALDARWVLVPKHLLPDIERLLSGKAVGPDDVPSTMDRLFNGDGNG